MLRKKVLLLLMLVTLLVSLSIPGGASANCSGDNCGCGYYSAQCREDCSYEPAEYYFTCVRSCTRQEVACAKACCAVF